MKTWTIRLEKAGDISFPANGLQDAAIKAQGILKLYGEGKDLAELHIMSPVLRLSASTSTEDLFTAEMMANKECHAKPVKK